MLMRLAVSLSVRLRCVEHYTDSARSWNRVVRFLVRLVHCMSGANVTCGTIGLYTAQC